MTIANPEDRLEGIKSTCLKWCPGLVLRYKYDETSSNSLIVIMYTAVHSGQALVFWYRIGSHTEHHRHSARQRVSVIACQEDVEWCNDKIRNIQCKQVLMKLIGRERSAIYRDQKIHYTEYIEIMIMLTQSLNAQAHDSGTTIIQGHPQRSVQRHSPVEE